MGLRTLTRTVSHNKSYRKTHTEDMFKTYFDLYWREKGHPMSSLGVGRSTKTFMKKGKRKGLRTKTVS